MKFSIRFADQIVGILVILALAILVFVIFMLGKNQRWFVQDPEYYTYFSSASGISTNMDVKYKGFTIGHVKIIELDENNRVKVIFSIYKEHESRVKVGSLVEVSVSPIGLGSSFNFYPGKGIDLIPAEGEVYDRNSKDGKDTIDANQVELLESGDGIGKLISSVNSTLESINTVPEGAEITALSKIMLDVGTATSDLSKLAGSLNERISPILDNLQTISAQISDPSGTVMSLLGSDGSLYTNLTSVIESLNGIVNNLEKTSEFLPTQLPQIGALINDINGLIVSMNGVLTSLENNPLIKDGIPERRETGPGAASPRNIPF